MTFFDQVEYKKSAKEKIDKNFTVLEKRPDVEHAVNTAKMQSNVSNASSSITCYSSRVVITF